MTNGEWLTPSEAGAILGVGPDRVAQLARQGVLRSMKTPGGHVRVLRQDVENLAHPPDDTPDDDLDSDESNDSEAEADESPPPPRPKWEDVPPWDRRVREAESDVKVMEFEEQQDRLSEAREERQAKQERAEAERAAVGEEAKRLAELRAFAISCVPWGVPADVEADVARQLERRVTSAQYPPGLAQQNAEALLRAEVERLLRPWRAREARRERARDEARDREDIIGWAVLHARTRSPRDWDWKTRQAFEREVRKALEEEYEPGMDQDDADKIAFEVLDEWLDGGNDD